MYGIVKPKVKAAKKCKSKGENLCLEAIQWDIKRKKSTTGSLNHLHAVEQIYNIPDSFPKGDLCSV